MISIFKKTTAYTLTSTLVCAMLFTSFEPIYLKAQSDSSSITVTLTVDSGITISEPVDISMTPQIGIVSNSAIGNQTWNVKTSDPDGYTLALRASTAPAMQQAAVPNDFFADYQTGAPNAWSVGASTKQFGYSAYGEHVSTSIWGNSTGCGSGGDPNNSLNYRGFTTTDYVVATGSSTTTTAGIDTSVCFAAAQNGTFAASGTYTANITATATVQ